MWKRKDEGPKGLSKEYMQVDYKVATTQHSLSTRSHPKHGNKKLVLLRAQVLCAYICNHVICGTVAHGNDVSSHSMLNEMVSKSNVLGL
jgi:hypothetical protein